MYRITQTCTLCKRHVIKKNLFGVKDYSQQVRTEEFGIACHFASPKREVWVKLRPK